MIYFLAIAWLVVFGLAFEAICLRWSMAGNLLKDFTGPHWFATLVSFLLSLSGALLFPGIHRDPNTRFFLFWPYRPVALIGSIGLFCIATVVYFKYVGRIQLKRNKRRKRTQGASASPMSNIQK
jgi:drug/metabolite transporter (DMT)-like permease